MWRMSRDTCRELPWSEPRGDLSLKSPQLRNKSLPQAFPEVRATTDGGDAPGRAPGPLGEDKVSRNFTLLSLQGVARVSCPAPSSLVPAVLLCLGIHS